MPEYWPALCTLAAIVALLVLIIWLKLQAFVALLVVSLGLGLAAGLGPLQTVQSVGKGVGAILAEVAILLALGSMLGRMLDVSGGRGHRPHAGECLRHSAPRSPCWSPPT